MNSKFKIGYMAMIASLSLALSLPTEAKAQGWPNFDVAETVSEVTNLISDITKTIKKPFEVLAVKDKIAVLGPLGESLGANMLGPLKGAMGDALGKVSMTQDNFTKKAAASQEQAKDYLLTESGAFVKKGQAITTEKLQEIRKVRQQQYMENVTEVYGIAMANRNRAADGLEERIDKINQMMNDAEDKRGAIAANTVAVVEICNELMALATMKVAQVKVEAAKNLNQLKSVEPVE